ncbi:diguanylate cyclase [Novosphingobium sp.]|uniref:GGDEF domain-containing protein n=1 Tax=Novosphingobium sp. TaxID=1874826 RepID=UPI002626D209|nr:diguanylate cyclase [Novosphingobium sp.]
MDWIWRRFVLFGLVALLSGLFGMTAAAAPIAASQTCHASGSGGERLGDLDRAPQRWICSDATYDVGPESLFLRFRLGDPAQPRAQSFVTHASPFAAITIRVTDADGAQTTARYTGEAARHLVAGPMMVLPLPQTVAPPREVAVRIDKPWNKTIGSEARLDSEPEGSGWDMAVVVTMAAICGMLVVPLLLNFGFYIVLRREFVLWHIVMVGLMLVQSVFGTGFIHILANPDAATEISINSLCFGAVAVSGLMFVVTFLEPDALPPALRRLFFACTPLVMAGGVFTALQFDVLRPFSALGIYSAILLAICLIVCGLAAAWHRGSKLVVFLMVGWAPTLLVGGYRIGCYLLPGTRPTESVVLFQLALAAEVLANSLGIVIRFLELRRERDLANARATELEGVAGRDALTGLWNRHSIERRFNDLFHLGYRTMAVIDLDHFKRINDRHGHAVGDSVLKVVAATLAEDAEACAIRMGGEEFLLLLRGAGSAERAERCRRALSARITAAIPGLEHVVTASMGVVEHDLSGTLDVEFAVLYSHCDRLLYEAKRLGRNRTMRERLTGFTPELQARTA